MINMNPEDTIHWPNVGSMLVHRLRRWFNMKPTLGECLVFAVESSSLREVIKVYNIG